jgi:two-component system, OmpR family, phosphate regulon sensor histidine kinase PhoR
MPRDLESTPRHHDRIFDRFYRVDKARAREVGGVGLGLAITKWAVVLNGGSLEVESAVGQGSKFRVRLATVR